MPPSEVASTAIGVTVGGGQLMVMPGSGGTLLDKWMHWLRHVISGNVLDSQKAKMTGDDGPTQWAVLVRALVLTGVAGLSVLLPTVHGLLQRRRKDASFEYGPIDITQMTPAAAKEMHGRPNGSLRKARSSLIPDALEDLEESAEMLAADALPANEEVDRRSQALAAVGAPSFRRILRDRAGVSDLLRKECTTLQVNIGLYCNQACTHCHVESSPLRKEQMSIDVVQRCLHLLRTSPSVTVLDITGGAPELNRGFKPLVEGAAALRDSGARPTLRIIDRCNLTVLLEPGQEDLLDFLVQYRVDIIASLPSYDAAQTDKQRGRKVFGRSMEALQMLNERGYGVARAKPEGQESASGLQLDLVFNPPGPFLPPRQELLEAKYHQKLRDEHGIQFDRLLSIANMPVKRFFDFLRKKGTLEGYMDLLVRNFNPDTVPQLMCLDTVSVGWDGRMYDCDFNQQLELSLGQPRFSVFDIDSLQDERVRQSKIKTGAHCYGCTAAQGSG
mmetsp:Transcript_82467/g.163705  ORF Transcript_82467/g.163705 Transcript_82467/m.163705 type:complete len:501 (+) Transcript_82467:81-1583(+)